MHPTIREYVTRFWRILLVVDSIFQEFRSRFIGKNSPVHFFWGSFDLAVTRFSGRRAPEREGADLITREAYSHEVISAGFWPGGGEIKGPAFYAYAAPEPAGYGQSPVRPAKAFYHPQMKEFFLMYDDVRTAPSPRTDAARISAKHLRSRRQPGEMGPGGAGTRRVGLNLRSRTSDKTHTQTLPESMSLALALRRSSKGSS